MYKKKTVSPPVILFVLQFNDCLVITRAKPFGKFKLKRNLPIHEVMVAQAPIKEEFTITSPKAAFRIYGS